MDNGLKKHLKKDRRIVGIEKKIMSGKGSFADTNKLAGAAGEVAFNLMDELLTEEYPNGQIPENDVRRIVSPVLKQLHEYVSGMTAEVVSVMNRKAGIGMKGVPSKYDVDRENAIVKKISERSYKDGPT